MSEFKKSALHAWLPAISLGFSSFIFVTTEMLPVGLLPDIALSLGKTEASTGILMTAYAWVVSLMSLPLTVLSGRINRRHLVLVLLGVFILGNVFSALAATFMLLVGARICIALAHAVFWSIVTPLAARAAPEGAKARAVSIVVTGSSLATVLGVPLGTILGHYFGWRISFAAVALGGCGVFAVLWLLLPSTPAANSGSFKSLPGIWRNKRLLMFYLITLVTVLGHFTAVTYFSPFMQQVGGFSPETVALLLLLLGGAGVVGGILGGKFSERPGRMTLFLPLAVLCALFALLPLAVRGGVVSAGICCLIWGSALTFSTLSYQIRVLGLSPRAVDVAVAIFSGTFNIGIGGGALIGSRIFTALGVGVTPYASAAFMGLAALISLLPQIYRSLEGAEEA